MWLNEDKTIFLLSYLRQAYELSLASIEWKHEYKALLIYSSGAILSYSNCMTGFDVLSIRPTRQIAWQI